MTKSIRRLVLTLVGIGLFAAISGVASASADNGYEQWMPGSGDACYYYWDGYQYAVSACPRTDGGFDFYAAIDGVWVFSISAGNTVDGGVWVFDGVQTSYYGGAATQATIGAPNWSGLTDNVVINQILIDSNNAIIDNILAPSCYEVVGGVCYY